MSDTSSSPNLLNKDNDNNDPFADGGEDDDDDDPSAGVGEEDNSSDEVTVDAVVEKKGRSRFQWSHTADCII